MERGRDRRARIAGGGDEDGDRRCIVGAQLRQGFGEEARSVVLDCCGGAVEQFEQIVAIPLRAGAAARRTRMPVCRSRQVEQVAIGERSEGKVSGSTCGTRGSAYQESK